MAAILNYCFEEELNPEAYGEIKEVGAKSRQVDQHGKTRLLSPLEKKTSLIKETY